MLLVFSPLLCFCLVPARYGFSFCGFCLFCVWVWHLLQIASANTPGLPLPNCMFFLIPHLISKQHLDPSFSVIVHKIAHCTWLADSLGLPRSASVLQVPTLPLRLQLCFNQACLISHASSSHSSQSCMQHASHPLSHPTTTSTAASCYYALNLVKVLFLA